MSEDQLCLVQRFDLLQVNLILLVNLTRRLLQQGPVRHNHSLKDIGALLRARSGFKFSKEILGAHWVRSLEFFRLV
jgi:hypothetical protein